MVTAIVATYDKHDRLLPRSLASIKAQEFQPEEVLVVNDGPPTDDCISIVEEFAKTYPHQVQLLNSSEKTGYYTQPRNLATAIAQGHYIANLDADNEWTPIHLSGLLTALRTPHPKNGWSHFAYGRRRYVSDEGAPPGLPNGLNMFSPWDERRAFLDRGPLANFVDSSEFIIGRGTLMYLAAKTGHVWDASLRRFGDYDLIFRLDKIGVRGLAVDQVSSIYHWDANNVQHTRKVERITDHVMISPDDYKVIQRAKERGEDLDFID